MVVGDKTRLLLAMRIDILQGAACRKVRSIVMRRFILRCRSRGNMYIEEKTDEQDGSD